MESLTKVWYLGDLYRNPGTKKMRDQETEFPHLGIRSNENKGVGK